MHTEVLKVLEKFNDKLCFFEPLGGNNGDTLIKLGAEEVFKKVGLKFVDDAKDSEVIIINGSGDLSYHSDKNPVDNSRQIKIIKEYKDKIIILLPSSCSATNAHRMSVLLKTEECFLIVFARDYISFENFKKYLPNKFQIFIDHDMAFGLIGSAFISNIKNRVEQRLLIVERFDEESASKTPFVYELKLIRNLLPDRVKSFFKTLFLKKIHATTSFVKEAKIKVREEYPEEMYLSVVAADISLPQNYSFEQFVYMIASSSVIVSTRLHVCILGFLLDKKIVLVQFEGGSKLLGVFEYSLRERARIWLRKR